MGFRGVLDLLPSLNSMLTLTLTNLFNSFITTNFSNFILVSRNFFSNTYHRIASGDTTIKSTIYMSKESHILDN